MPECTGEEHELPAVEAVLAGTLALMTGYSQALQAELHPEHRVLMGRKIGNNLALLAEHPQLSTSFQAVLGGLKRRWAQMAGCTAEAAQACAASSGSEPCQAQHQKQHQLQRQSPCPQQHPHEWPRTDAVPRHATPGLQPGAVVCEAPRTLQ